MKQETVKARVELDSYTNKVLGIIKIKYGLRDKSGAINKFIELYGEEVVEKEVSDEYLRKVVELTGKHMKKYGKRKMGVDELDALIENV